MFSFEDFGALSLQLKHMFTAGSQLISNDALSVIMSYAPLLAVSVLACVPLWRNIYARLHEMKFMGFVEILAVCAIMVMCTAALVNDSYNPFLYFRF